MAEEAKQPEVILTLDRVNKYFKKQGSLFRAINEATFEVHQGDFFGIIGESGSGKSTTGKMIIRLYDVNGGTIIFDNNLISQRKISKRTNRWLTQTMQMIFQDPMSSLNPKKNVLSLISEPLRINGKLKKEAIKIIRDHGMINPYFQYTYKTQDFEKSKEFEEKYYLPLIQLYTDAIEKIRHYQFDPEDDAEELMYNLSSFLSEFEEEGKKINDNVYTYAQSFKDIYRQCLNKHLNHENHPAEVQLFESIEERKHLRKYLFNSKKHWDNLSRYKQSRKELQEYEGTIDESYRKQAKTFIQSIDESHQADLKLLRQELSITNQYTNYLYTQVQILGLMIFIEAFEEIKQLKFLAIQQIQGLSKRLKTAVDAEILPLMEQVLHLKELETQKDDFFNRILKADQTLNQAEIDLVRHVTPKQLHENATLEAFIQRKFGENQAEYFQLLNEIDHESRIVENQLAQFQTIPLIEMVGVYVIIQEARNLSSRTEMEYKTKQQTLQLEKQTAKKCLVETATGFFKWLSSEEAKTARKTYQTAVKTEQDNRKICQSHYKKDIDAFNQNVAPQIRQFQKDNQDKRRQLYFLRLKYQMVVWTFGQRAVKELWKRHQKLRTFWEQRRTLEREVFTKIKNQSALKFEYETTMEEIGLYRSLRSKSALIRRLNKRFLVKVLTREKVYDALTSVGLKNEHAYRYPHEFSGGQRQRIVIARALINNPKLIIADEPISALDVSIQAQVVNIMKNLAKEKGITFLFIAHDLSMVNYACNRMIIMHNGQIVEKGNTDEIFRNPVHPYTLSLIKAAPQLSKIHVDLASFSALENYAAGYSILNKPSFHQIQEDSEHFVYGTDQQITDWNHQALRARHARQADHSSDK